jgi:hypothetical protein
MRALSTAMATVAACLLFASGASAATRFAGPGGNGVEPCDDPGNPCSIFRAAGGQGGAINGDEVVLAPGEYSDAAGDLGPDGFVQVQPGVHVSGAADRPRPVVHLARSNGGVGAFVVEAAVTVSHVEIESEVATANITVSDNGIVEDVIARSSSDASGAIVCVHRGGLIRDSACLSSGDGAIALGSFANLGAPLTTRLRNVTAVATGLGSSGLSYAVFGDGSLDVFAKSVIASGKARDVFAAGLRTGPTAPGGEIRIELDHAAYATVETRTDDGGGTASVTPPGTADNITEPPRLAADGYHQLLGSPTVNAGAVDDFSRAIDIDGEPRGGDGTPDIGADEGVADVPVTPPPPPPPGPPPSESPPEPPTTRAPLPPQTRLGKHPAANERKPLTVFTFSANPAGGRFECRLDAQPFRRCTSPFRATVKPGRHTFRVRAVGPGGADPTPVSFSWKVSRAPR